MQKVDSHLTNSRTLCSRGIMISIKKIFLSKLRHVVHQNSKDRDHLLPYLHTLVSLVSHFDSVATVRRKTAYK